MTVQRYKIQQTSGDYCLKGCDDGDLVDWTAYDSLARELAECRAQSESHLDAYNVLANKHYFLTREIAECRARLKGAERHIVALIYDTGSDTDVRRAALRWIAQWQADSAIDAARGGEGEK